MTIHKQLSIDDRSSISHSLIPYNNLSFHILRLDVRITSTPLSLLMIKLRHLLLIHLPMLQQERLLRNDMRLPRQRPHILGSQRIRKHILHLLQRLPRRLREREEDMHQHREVEHAEDDVRLPLDVDKRRRDEVAQGEVEGPIRRRGERNGFPAHAQWLQFGRVNPGDGAPGGGVGGDEEVGASDDGFGWRAGDCP